MSSLLYNSDIYWAALATTGAIYPLWCVLHALNQRHVREFAVLMLLMGSYPWVLAGLQLHLYDSGLVYAFCIPMLPIYAATMGRYIGYDSERLYRLVNPLFLLSVPLVLFAATNPMHGQFAVFEPAVPGQSTHVLRHTTALVGLKLTMAFALIVTLGTSLLTAVEYARSRCTLMQVVGGLVIPITALATIFEPVAYITIFGEPVSTFVLPCLASLLLLNYGFMQGDLSSSIPISASKMIQQMPDAVAVIDEAGRINDCNPAFAKLFGRAKKDLLRRQMRHLLPDDELVDDASIAYGDSHYNLRITEIADQVKQEAIWVMRDVTQTTNALLASEEQRQALQTANVELARLSSTDPLTGLWNRRYFEQQLEKDLITQRRSRNKLGLLLIDVDHFKQVNDRYGHQMGDKVLLEIAQIMHAQCRAGDVLCRIGGEEFAVLLANTDAEGLAFAAERIRSSVATHTIQTPDHARVSPTVSIGGLTVNPGESAVAVLGAVDRALYEAKNQGRNSVALRDQDATLRVVN